MNKFKLFFYPFLIASFFFTLSLSFLEFEKPLSDNELGRLKYEKFLAEHPYNNRNVEADKKIDKMDRPDLAAEQDFMRTMDLSLGRPAPERLQSIYKQVEQFTAAKGPVGLQWTERGPNNVGGRTRTIMFDPNDNTNKKVWAGGVGGGLWYTNDITASNPTWTKVNDVWENIGITTFAYDPANKNHFYVGTGEGWANLDAQNGAGIWKSTDAGVNWSRLESTNNSKFKTIQKIIVTGGKIYCATPANGIQRSDDGGLTWANVLGSSNFAADIEVGTDGTIYASLGKGNVQGSIWKSSTGNAGEWTQINNGGTNGIPSSGIYRTELACAPNNANVVYAIVSGPNGGSSLLNIYYSNNKGATWTTCAKPNWSDAGGSASTTDFTRGQAWYDLSMAVDPNNAATLIVGGVDLFISTNNGTAWTQMSDWSGSQFSGFPEVHADQHAVMYVPGSSTSAIFGNDGGVWYTSNLTASPSALRAFANRNNGYNVTQFYACAMAGGSGVNYYLAGAQDNGTQKFTTVGINATTEVTGGDGGFCFIDQDDQNYQITSYVYNSYYLSTNGGTSFTTQFGSRNKGRFINPADYDSKENIMYGCYDNVSIERYTGMTGTRTQSVIPIAGLGSYASHLSVSPYAAAGKSNVFVGTEAGRIFKLTDAHATPVITEITGNLPFGTVSCIEVGASEQELLVTFSNYGLTSVWYTSDGGQNWINKEGDLPDMPVRWAIFKPSDRKQVMIATEVGVWSTYDLSESEPKWIPSASGMANTRVDMLQIRASDKQVIAATHGRGLFSTMSFATSNVGAAFVSSDPNACPGAQIQFTDKSVNQPTSWEWSFEGGNPSTSSQQNPIITYPTAGKFKVTLIVINASSRDTVKKLNYVNIEIPMAEVALPIAESFKGNSMPNQWFVKNPDNDTTWRLNKDAGAYGLDTASLVFPNSVNAKRGAVDDILLPKFELDSNNQTLFSFDYAYMYSSSSFADTLRLMYKTCSNDWKVLWEKGGKTLSTASLAGGYFVPKANQWKSDTIDISNLKDLGVIQFKFQNYSNSGKNIYLDNINVSANVALLPVPKFSVNKINLCAGQSALFTDLSTNNPDTWEWTFEGGNPASSNLQNPEVIYENAGTYAVTLKCGNAAGDSSIVKSNLITVTAAPLANFLSVDTAYLISGEAEVSFGNISENAMNYQWDFGDGETSSLESPSHIYKSIGNYMVQLIATNNSCSDTFSKSIHILTAVGIENLNFEKFVKVYPNPANKVLLVELPTNLNFDKLELMDMSGKLVYTQNEKHHKARIDVSEFSEGMYFLHIHFGEKTVLKKIIIKAN